MIGLPYISQWHATISLDCPMRFYRLCHGLAWSFWCFPYRPLDCLPVVVQVCTRPLWMQDVALGSNGENVDTLVRLNYFGTQSPIMRVSTNSRYHPSTGDTEPGSLLSRRLRLRRTTRDCRVFHLCRDWTASVRNCTWSAGKYLKETWKWCKNFQEGWFWNRIEALRVLLRSKPPVFLDGFSVFLVTDVPKQLQNIVFIKF